MLPPDFKLQRLDTPVEPLSLAEAKLFARVETAADDLLFPDLITAARLKCEQVANSSLTAASYRLTCDYLPWGGILPFLGAWQLPTSWWSAGIIDLPNPPLVAVSAIRYVGMDNQVHTLDPVAYRVSPGTPGQVQPAYGVSWPFMLSEVAAVTIDYTAGMTAETQAAVKTAMRFAVNHLYTYRAGDVPFPEDLIRSVLGKAVNYGYA